MSSACSILVVDDEPLILNMTVLVLSPEFTVLKAESAEDAQDLLTHCDVDIILADLHLPNCSGVDLLEWQRQRRPQTVRILMTGHGLLEDAINAINRGQVHRFLTKPWRPDQLLHELRTVRGNILLQRSYDRLLEESQLLNAQLEQRVQERTRELAEANRQLQLKNSVLEKMALTDSLTGIPNRRAVERIARGELNRRLRLNRPLTIGIIDIDYFKQINSAHLLSGGDHVLIWLAQLLTRTIRSIDTVGRMGGEEFMLVAPDTDRTGALELAERLRMCVERESTTFNSQEIRVTISLGIVVSDGDTHPGYDEMHHLASVALSEAKRAGRNRTVLVAAPTGS